MQKTLCAVILGVAVLSGMAAAEENAKLKDALAFMKEKTSALGTPKSEGIALFFGTTKMNGNYEIVDAVRTKFGCVATFFVKKETQFIRVSTNVQKEGNRAVGTKLDPEGKAIGVVSKGEIYQGEADILGTKHDTIYEPFKNDKNEVVGLFFVGIPK